MAKQHGRFQTFTWNALAVNGLVDGALNLERPRLDSTCHDDGDARSSIQGRLEGTVEVNGFYNEADSGQSGMQADHVTGTERAIVFRMKTGSTLHEFTGTGQIESWSINGPNDAPGEFNASVRFNGAVVEAVQ